jgi:hypothetical protein
VPWRRAGVSRATRRIRTIVPLDSSTLGLHFAPRRARRPGFQSTMGGTMTQNDHSEEHEEHTHGMALGFRIFDNEGELFFVEAEVASYLDEPGALGATLVFHRLSGIDPTSAEEDEDIDWSSWPLDIDEELTRDEGAPATQQFESILRQLSRLSEDELRGYLRRAMEEEKGEDEE